MIRYRHAHFFLSLLLFSISPSASGSTGKPKGVVHTTAGYMVYAATAFKYVFNYVGADVFFCTADLGWITGHTVNCYGSLANAATIVSNHFIFFSFLLFFCFSWRNCLINFNRINIASRWNEQLKGNCCHFLAILIIPFLLHILNITKYETSGAFRRHTILSDSFAIVRNDCSAQSEHFLHGSDRYSGTDGLRWQMDRRVNKHDQNNAIKMKLIKIENQSIFFRMQKQQSRFK